MFLEGGGRSLLLAVSRQLTATPACGRTCACVISLLRRFHPLCYKGRSSKRIDCLLSRTFMCLDFCSLRKCWVFSFGITSLPVVTVVPSVNIIVAKLVSFSKVSKTFKILLSSAGWRTSLCHGKMSVVCQSVVCPQLLLLYSTGQNLNN